VRKENLPRFHICSRSLLASAENGSFPPQSVSKTAEIKHNNANFIKTTGKFKAFLETSSWPQAIQLDEFADCSTHLPIGFAAFRKSSLDPKYVIQDSPRNEQYLSTPVSFNSSQRQIRRQQS
jgi:hypothetical protein